MSFPRILRHLAISLSVCSVASAPVLLFAADPSPLHRGYYRSPAIHGDTIVFTSEGDLWSVSVHGGAAHRLTSNTGTESDAIISPDGKTVAFAANSKDPREVYTMPIDGGLPQRRTWDGDAAPQGWAPDGRLLVATGALLHAARRATCAHRRSRRAGDRAARAGR